MSKEISSQFEEDKNIPLLKTKLNQWGVELVCWDLDGTLIDTSRTFSEALIDASALLLFGRKDDLSERERSEALSIRKKVSPIFSGIRDEFLVRPEISEVAVILIARGLGLDPEENKTILARQRAKDLYRLDRPSPFPGSRKSVDQFNATGIRSVLTSHAERDWIMKKLASAGFTGKFEQIVALSVDERKSDQWPDIFSNLGVNSENILIIGDNFKEDIMPTVNLGARTIWVNSDPDRREQLLKFSLENPNNGIIEIPVISQLVDRIISS